MEKQLVQFMNNVKAYCKRILMLAVAASFACAALITADGEAAKNVRPFKQVALSECTQEETYAFGDIQLEDYDVIQNQVMVEEALLAAGEVEPEVVDKEEKETAVVAQSYSALSAEPVYADPSMNGYECLGTYLTTGYCACVSCCGKTNGITACGVTAQANHTIAADTGVLPFGTQVVINGKVYTVEDRGSAIRGNRIDIYFASHSEALNYGKRYVRIYRYVGTSENASSVAVEVISETPDIETTTTEATTESVTTGTTESTAASTTATATTSTSVSKTSTEATTEAPKSTTEATTAASTEAVSTTEVVNK